MSQPLTLCDFPNQGRKLPAFAKRLIKSLAALAIFVLVGLTMLFALLWREHKTEITLPAPTGHFAVGRTTYTWVNNAETDELALSSGAKREVVVWIWYPSAAATSAAPVEYLPAPWRLADAQYSGVLMSQFFTRDLSLVRAHSTSDPEVSSEQRSYPVVIMRAGGGASIPNFNLFFSSRSPRCRRLVQNKSFRFPASRETNQSRRTRKLTPCRTGRFQGREAPEQHIESIWHRIRKRRNLTRRVLP